MLIACAQSRAATESAGDWKALTDAGNLSAWKSYGKPAQSPVGWTLENGVLAWKKGAGNLVTRETFADFELELEWKISPGGNSGVMFGVDESGDKPWHSGPEIQILDDTTHRDGLSPLTRAGALYSLYAPTKAAAKRVGEWNALRVRVQQGRVQCWLNGEPVVDVTMGGADWNARVAQSKFARFAQFARVKDGRILLQDHGDPVWFRDIRIRRL
jgi:hypothetical protein